MRKCRHILLTVLIFALSACSSTGPVQDSDPLTPFPGTLASPGNEVLVRAIKDYLAATNNPVSSQYNFSRQDLNGDGLEDALVLFKNPYGHWCSQHGCTMLVMKAHRGHFTVVNAIQPVRTPLYVSMIKTNGWKDLIILVSGRQESTKNVAMRFDGRKYPADPSSLPAYPVRYIRNLGMKIFP